MRGISGLSSKLVTFALSGAALAPACAPVKSTASKTSTHKDFGNASGIHSPGGSLTLPSWCSQTQTADQVCFRCDREDGGVVIPYEQCLTPSESFQASRDCAYRGDLTKSIACAGAAGGKPFVMDVSTAKEKASVAIPAFLIAVNITILQKYPDRSDIKAILSDVTSFTSSHLPRVFDGADTSQTSGDLLMLMQKHMSTKLSPSEEELIKTSFSAAFRAISADLSGKKDYNLARLLTRLSGASLTIPAGVIGEARPFLTTQYLASLMSEDSHQALFKTFSALNPAILGIKSVDDLIAELKKGTLCCSVGPSD